MAIANTDPTERALFPEGLKAICRTCPYRCSFTHLNPKELDSDISEEDGNDIGEGGSDLGLEDDNDDVEDIDGIYDPADSDSERTKYAQAVIDEVCQLQDSRVSSPLADQRFPNQAFQFPLRQTNSTLNKPPLERIATHMITMIKASISQSKRYGEFLDNATGVEESLLDALTPAAKEAFKKDSIDLTA